MSPADIIVASTSRPTEVLKIKDTGTLTKGKRADFIVLNANPLENIRNTRAIDSVFLYGAKLDRAELQAKFRKLSSIAMHIKPRRRKTTCRTRRHPEKRRITEFRPIRRSIQSPLRSR